MPLKGANSLGLSRMEKYIAIIKVLNNWDSITQKQIMRKAELNLVSPKEYLNFLVKLDLIREETLGNKTSYSITYKGQRITDFSLCVLRTPWLNYGEFFGTALELHNSQKSN